MTCENADHGINDGRSTSKQMVAGRNRNRLFFFLPFACFIPFLGLATIALGFLSFKAKDVSLLRNLGAILIMLIGIFLLVGQVLHFARELAKSEERLSGGFMQCVILWGGAGLFAITAVIVDVILDGLNFYNAVGAGVSGAVVGFGLAYYLQLLAAKQVVGRKSSDAKS